MRSVNDLQAHRRAATCRRLTSGATWSAATISALRIGLVVRVVLTGASPLPSARRRGVSRRAPGKGIPMPWFRDAQSPLGVRLRTLVVLGLVMTVVLAVLAETSLRAVGGLPAWLTLDGTATVAGS